jgi:starch-binding outer membrane protein, SusD/RagB family
MKVNKILIAICALFFGVAISCNESFLVKEPFGSVNEAVLSSTVKGAETLLIAAYSNLDGFSGWDRGNIWGGAASNWSFGSVAGGDAYKGSEAGDQPDVTPIELHTVDPNNPYLEGKWGTYYDGVSRCNSAIKTFKALKDVPEALRATRIAEARFLRGLYHYELWKVFKNVPYIDETLTEVRIGNSTDILPKIQADLQAAVTALPLKQEEIGRATKGAAQAVLANSLMWQKKYGEAKALYDAIISSGVYALNAKYHDNFDAATRNTKEGILEVQQTVNDGTTDNGNNGDVLNYPYNGGPAACCGFHQPSQNLVNAFRVDAAGLPFLDTFNDVDVKSDNNIKTSDPFVPETAALDPRLDWTVGRRGIPYLDWGKHQGSVWVRDQAYSGPYAPIKNVHSKDQEGKGEVVTASGWTKGYNANNLKLIRYSDVLLQAAEAEVELGNLEAARKLVNQVRKRAANPAGFVLDGDKPAANYKISEYTAAWTDANVARKAVRHERRIELGMEGHRFFDLVRWGVAQSEKDKYFAKEKTLRPYLGGAKFTTGKSEVFPIPAKALTQSAIDGKPTLKQNPGY